MAALAEPLLARADAGAPQATREDLRAFERRTRCFLGLGACVHVLALVVLLAWARGPAGAGPQPLAAQPDTLIGETGPSAQPMRTSSRKLHMLYGFACGSCLGDVIGIQMLGALAPFANTLGTTSTRLMPNWDRTQLFGKLTVLGNVNVQDGDVKVVGDIDVPLGNVSLPLGKLKVSTAEIATTAEIGTQYKASANGPPVLYAYGGQYSGSQPGATEASPSKFVTQISPGKVLTTWPDVTPSNGAIDAVTSLGTNEDDELSSPSLAVFATSALGTKWTKDADTAGKVCSIYGDAWLGQDTSGGTVHLTRIRPGKVSNSWPRRDGRSGTEEASIGKRASEAHLSFQLNVFGNATLGTGGAAPLLPKNYRT